MDVMLKTLIKRFGTLTLTQGLNLIAPFVGLVIPILEQVLEHHEMIFETIKMIK